MRRVAVVILIVLLLGIIFVLAKANSKANRAAALFATPPTNAASKGAQSTVSTELHYIGSDNMPHTAHLSDTNVHAVGPWHYVDDPVWVDKNDAGPTEAGSKWLRYHADDGRLWSATVHCTYQDFELGPGTCHDMIVCWFEHQGNGDDHNDQFIQFQNSSGGVSRAYIGCVETGGPNQPSFVITPLQAETASH
jgi:hypothetical protein